MSVFVKDASLVVDLKPHAAMISVRPKGQPKEFGRMKIGGGLSASEEEHIRGLWHLLCSPHLLKHFRSLQGTFRPTHLSLVPCTTSCTYLFLYIAEVSWLDTARHGHPHSGVLGRVPGSLFLFLFILHRTPVRCSLQYKYHFTGHP